jgi:hypothetical protein
VLAACLLLIAGSRAVAQERASLDLDGAWQFQTDPRQVGERDGWTAVAAPASWAAQARTIQVPGAWQAQGVGEPSGILRHHYAGDAWYRRIVAVPAAWKGRRILLTIGGAHRSTSLFVNGIALGTHDGFSAPFEFDVSSAIRPGRDNTIALRVSNPGATDLESPDKQAGAQATGMLNYIANWGGIYSHVRLVATERVWIDRVLIVPDAEKRAARVEVTLGGASAAPARGARIRVNVADASGAGPANSPTATPSSAAPSLPAPGSATAPPAAGRSAAAGTTFTNATAEAAVAASGGDGGAIVVSVPMTGASLWTPEQPRLYVASIELLDDRGRVRDRVEERFGLRTITTRGPVLLLNGQPLYLRGYGDDNIELLTGLPPASKDIYRERLSRAKAFGFNAVRFHSMTPVREFFEAADEVGMLVMAELPAAYTQYLLPHKTLLRGELTRTLLAYRNHPSLLSLAFGNEFNLGWLKTDAQKREFLDTIADFYQLAKSLDPTRPILSTDGLHIDPTDMVSLYSGYADNLPTLRHEFGQYYCSLPDPSLMPRFTGAVEPTWLDTKRRWVESKGLTASYPTYVQHSQRLQQLGRAFQIETVRRDPRVTGYHYWLIADYPGGTGEGDSWEEGWFDYFWQPKGIAPEEGRRLNSAVLALIDADVDRRTFWNEEGKTVQVTVSNYGGAPLAGAPATWRWTAAGGRVLASGTASVTVPQGEVRSAFTAMLPQGVGDREREAAIDLEVEIAAGPQEHEHAVNRWRFWSVPKQAVQATIPPLDRPLLPSAGDSVKIGDVLIASRLDAEAKAALDAGGRVLLLAEPARAPASGSEKDKDKPKNGARTTTFFPGTGAAIGTIVRDHPALEGLPHEGFADLQFYNLLQGAGAFGLDDAPGGFEPIVDAIRTATGWLSKSKDLTRTGFLIEANVGRGRLLATTFNVRPHLDAAHPDIVWLFDRLLRYASSDRFAPRATLTSAQLQAMMAPLEGVAP